MEGGLCCTGGERIIGNSHPSLSRVIEIGCVCNNAALTNGTLIGQPTEGALLVLAMKVLFTIVIISFFYYGITSIILFDKYVLTYANPLTFGHYKFQAHIDERRSFYRRTEEIPFTSDSKFMAVQCEFKDAVSCTFQQI